MVFFPKRDEILESPDSKFLVSIGGDIELKKHAAYIVEMELKPSLYSFQKNWEIYPFFVLDANNDFCILVKIPKDSKKIVLKCSRCIAIASIPMNRRIEIAGGVLVTRSMPNNGIHFRNAKNVVEYTSSDEESEKPCLEQKKRRVSVDFETLKKDTKKIKKKAEERKRRKRQKKHEE